MLRAVSKAAVCVNEDASVAKVRKCCIVCPATLVRNWLDENKKWFGRVSSNVALIGALETAGGGFQGGVETIAQAVSRWTASDGRACCHVLVISYESFARHAATLEQDAQLDLLVLDEGHRLKAGSGSKVADCVKRSRAKLRLLITGTPVMNDLGEFFNLADCVNPGVFGDRADFRHNFTKPIELGAGRKADRDTRETPPRRTRARTF